MLWQPVLSSNSTIPHLCPFTFSLLHTPLLVLSPLLLFCCNWMLQDLLKKRTDNNTALLHKISTQNFIWCKVSVSPSPVSIHFIYKKMHKQGTSIYHLHSFKNTNHNIRGSLCSLLNSQESGNSLQKWDWLGTGVIEQRFTGAVSSFKLTQSERTKRIPKFCTCGSNLNICF